MQKNVFYGTKDLHLAAFLISSGCCSLEKIEDSFANKKRFLLKPNPSDQDIDSFYNGTGMVSGLRLCDTMRSLKAAVLARR